MIDITPEEILELKLLKDRLAARLVEVRRTSYVRDERNHMQAVPSDEARDLERSIAVIQRILLKAARQLQPK